MGGRGKALVAGAVVAALGAAGLITVVSSWADMPNVVISEVMTSNGSTLLDEDLESADWIELWNRSSTAVDLTGWRLSDDDGDDDEDEEAEWAFPRLTLAAGDRMVIFASGKADRHPLHTDFRLSADGEQVDLRDASGREVNQQELPALGTDVSYGLGSDGRVGVLMTPTPGLPNSPIQAARWGFAGAQTLGRREWEAEVNWVERVWFGNREEIVLDQLRADQLIDGES